MDNAIGVDEGHCVNDLERNLTGAGFGNVEAAFEEVVVEVAALEEFHHDVEVFIVLEVVIHFNDVRVLHHFEGVDFFSCEREGLFVHFLLVCGLNCNLLFC